MVLALGLALLVFGVVDSIQSDADDETNQTSEKTSDESIKAGCVAECRADYPGGGADYINCRQNCG